MGKIKIRDDTTGEGVEKRGPSCTAARRLSRFSRVQLCNAMDCSPPGSCVHGILQARILEWVAISFSRGILPTQGSNPGFPHYGQTL